ncbi:MAG TPA: TetR family transcriptional regulator, partial [Myxococcota bacterium]
MRGYLRELADAAGASDPAALADELALLLEGATVTAQVSGDRRAAQTAKRIARSIIDEALEAG